VSVSVVTDSAASLPPELADALGAHIVPMQLEIGDRVVDERTVPMDELVASLGHDVRTSGPSPGAFMRRWKDFRPTTG
jgi:fatty acid-binding protein DegV